MKTKIFEKAGRGLACLVLAGGVASTNGCGTIASNPVVQGFAVQGIGTAIDASIRNKIEGPRGTTINVYNNGDGTYSINQGNCEYPNVIREHGMVTPVQGFAWVDPKAPARANYRVVPIGGGNYNINQGNCEYPNVIREHGMLTPVQGFAWVDPKAPARTNYSVVPIR